MLANRRLTSVAAGRGHGVSPPSDRCRRWQVPTAGLCRRHPPTHLGTPLRSLGIIKPRTRSARSFFGNVLHHTGQFGLHHSSNPCLQRPVRAVPRLHMYTRGTSHPRHPHPLVCG